jgi:transcription initiation factor TFIID subunit 2
MIFHLPVDPVALGIPHYFDVIPKEDARDLTTIKGRLDKGMYQSADQLNQDIVLMFSNAYKFNGRGSPIADIAEGLEKSWLKLYNSARATVENNHVNKKQRLA